MQHPTKNRQLFTGVTSLSIQNSRLTITRDDIGEQLDNLEIQSNGQFYSAADDAKRNPDAANHFDKMVYNLKANSASALASPEIRALRLAGLRAETEGDVMKADELFEEWLNRTQVSFSVIVGNGRTAPTFFKGQQVICTVEEVTSKRGITSLQVRNVQPKPAKKARKVVFTDADLIDTSVPTAAEVYNVEKVIS